MLLAIWLPVCPVLAADSAPPKATAKVYELERTGWRVSAPIGFEEKPGNSANALHWFVRWKGVPPWYKNWTLPPPDRYVNIGLVAYEDAAECRPECERESVRRSGMIEGSHYGWKTFSFTCDSVHKHEDGHPMNIFDSYLVKLEPGCLRLKLTSEWDTRAKYLATFRTMQGTLQPVDAGKPPRKPSDPDPAPADRAVPLLR